MHRIQMLVPAVAALALSSGALAEETPAQAAVRSFKLNYSFTVKDVPADAQSIKVWVPLPQSNSWQVVGETSTESNVEPTLVTDPLYGNNFYLFDFSGAAPSDDGTYAATLSF